MPETTEDNLTLSFQDFAKEICGKVRVSSSKYSKDSTQDFINAVKQMYGIRIGAKWDEEKDTFFISFYYDDLIHIFKNNINA